MKAYPPLKYSLAILGIVSVIAIIKAFGIDLRVAVFGTITMMVLMVALVVFAALTRSKNEHVHYAALVMMWSFLLITLLSAALLFTSAFFDYPKRLQELVPLTSRNGEKIVDPRDLPPGGSILYAPRNGEPSVTTEVIPKPEKGARVPPP
jgi:hypothetical protein